MSILDTGMTTLVVGSNHNIHTVMPGHLKLIDFRKAKIPLLLVNSFRSPISSTEKLRREEVCVSFNNEDAKEFLSLHILLHLIQDGTELMTKVQKDISLPH
ncbi:MAG: hypothetical protein ACR5K2_04430 [Wolbachia sp.]